MPKSLAFAPLGCQQLSSLAVRLGVPERLFSEWEDLDLAARIEKDERDNLGPDQAQDRKNSFHRFAVNHRKASS